MKSENIRNLKSNQIHLEKLRETYQKELDSFTTKNAALIASIEVVSSKQEEIKQEVRIEAVEEFEESGEKKLLGGIGIRVSTKLFYDEVNAILWAKENMPIAIIESVDKKQFETFAKENHLDFVKKEESVSVTFPKEIKI